MKSEGVKEVVKWMEAELKKQKARVDEAERRHSSIAEVGDYFDRARDEERTRLQTMVAWKISTERYMKKLQHEGQ